MSFVFNHHLTELFGIPVTSHKDLPPPVMKNGVLTIIPEGELYVFRKSFDNPYPIAHPGRGKSVTFKALNDAKCNYTGTDSCFRDLEADGYIECRGQVEFTAVNGNMWDIVSSTSPGTDASFQATNLARFRNCLSLGSVEGPDFAFNIGNGSVTGFDTGLVVTNTYFFEINTTFVSSTKTQPTTYFTVTGDQTTGDVNFLLLSSSPATNQTLLHLDKSIESSVDSILIQTVQQLREPSLGATFSPDGLTQASVKVTSQGNSVIPDSTIKGKLNINNNTLTTVLNDTNVPEPINTIWTDGQIEERICFRDLVTFDSSTNTCNTTFDHTMSNGDTVSLREKGGLPAELEEDVKYFLVNVTATSFQLSLTSGGPVVTFSDNGTPENYYNHDTGTSSTGWMTYVGLVEKSIQVGGWVALTKSGTTRRGAVRVMKINEDFSITPEARGSVVSVSNNTSQSSSVEDIITLKPHEGIVIYMETPDLTVNDMVATDAVISIKQA